MNQALTTTEELIVQYLDGELVRKELEMVLFERLATSEDARHLLREHLTMRGAIRMSGEDERFVLSDDLDHRTRTRLETMLESMTPIPAPMLLEDRPAISTQPATRSMKRFAVRPAYAALLLLLAVGTTWMLSRNTATTQIAEAPKTAAAPEQVVTAAPVKSDIAASISQTSANQAEPKVIVKEVVRYLPATTAPIKSTPSVSSGNTELASNGQPEKQTPAEAKPTEPANDPADIMMSHRLPKLIKTLESKEITITDRDRL